MTKLSVWAKHHSCKARCLIILLHFMLIILAVYTGNSLWQLQLQIPVPVIYIVSSIFFAVVWCYPERGQRNTKFTKQQLYIIRKSCDAALAACSFVLVCFAANKYFNGSTPATFYAVAATSLIKPDKPAAADILASLAYRDKSSLTRSEKRILRDEFKHQLKLYAKAKLTGDDEAAAKAIFITLSIIGAVGLTFLLAGLACSISCNGSEAAATLVTLVGLAAIIFLLIVVIKKIKKHGKGSLQETKHE